LPPVPFPAYSIPYPRIANKSLAIGIDILTESQVLISVVIPQITICGANLEKNIQNLGVFVAHLRNISYLCNRNNKEMEQTVFELDLLEEARDFLKSLTKEIRGKIGYNIRRVQKGERDNELFKKLDGTEIWEFRTIYNKTYYRLFAFWDKDINTLVVATHGIVKKTQKTPKSEITKAEGIRKLYFENKNKKI
jgi:phage-related protein